MLHGIDRMFDHDHDGKLNTAERVARNAYLERMLAQDESEEESAYGSDEDDEEPDFGLNENDDEDEYDEDYDEDDGSYGFDSEYDSEDFGGDDYNSDFGEDF